MVKSTGAAGESKKGHGRDALEESGMRSEFSGSHQRFDGSVDAGPGRGEILVRNIFAVDADALVDAFQVRRSVQTGAQSSRAQDGFQHRGRGAFAVGSGDVRAGRGALRLAEIFRKNRDIREAEFLHASLLRSGQFPAQRK